jgi:hypothetical protein
MDGREGDQEEAAARPQISAPSDAAGAGDAAAFRLLALPAGLLVCVARRLEPVDQRALRSVCRAARAELRLPRLTVCGAPLNFRRRRRCFSPRPPPPQPRLTSHMCRRSPPQVNEGNAGEVCAAALDGRLAAAFPALRMLSISPLALQAMAQEHDAEHLAVALAGVGGLEALEVGSPFAPGERPPALQDAGALLAQLVARRPRLQGLSLQIFDPGFSEVRAPCPEAAAAPPAPSALALHPAQLAAGAADGPPAVSAAPPHSTRPLSPAFRALAAARRSSRRSACSVGSSGGRAATRA